MFDLAAFSLYDLAFLLIAGITVTAALGVVLFKNIIYSALSLILAFLGAAAVYFQLNASFLGVIQILVYAGAISVLIIFAIMLVMDRAAGESNLRSPRTREVFTGGAITAMLFTALIAVIGFTQWPLGVRPGPDNSVGLLAELMLGDYVIAMEAAAILLLVAVVGAIILAKGVEKK